MPGDQGDKAEREMGGWHQLRFSSTSGCLPSCTPAMSLTGTPNLLEFLHFCFEDFLSESTLKQRQRGRLLRRGKKKKSLVILKRLVRLSLQG